MLMATAKLGMPPAIAVTCNTGAGTAVPEQVHVAIGVAPVMDAA